MTNKFTPITVDTRPVLGEAVVFRKAVGNGDMLHGKVTAVGPDMIAVKYPDLSDGKPRIGIAHRRDDGTFQSLDRWVLGRTGPSKLDLVTADRDALAVALQDLLTMYKGHGNRTLDETDRSEWRAADELIAKGRA